MDKQKKPTVLVVDDDPDLLDLVGIWLTGLACDPVLCTSGKAALTVLDRREVQLALVDVRMPEMDGFELLEVIRKTSEFPVIMMTVDSSVEGAVAAMQGGAFDYLPKPLALETVRKAVDHAIEPLALRVEVARLRKTLDDRFGRGSVISESACMRSAITLAEKVTDSNLPVLLSGESGVGKEVFAKLIHFGGQRSAEPFVAVNCAAIPADLMESELFGHEKGAFTGASRRRVGKLEEAAGGTLFFDEIGELAMSLQPKLLRVLQERTFSAVGSNRELPLRARVLAATNRDLEAAVADGSFREDLFYRLNVVNIEIPPLRDRPEDIPHLVAEFVRRFNDQEGRNIRGVTPAALESLGGHGWPGNVRELENVVFRAGLVAGSPIIDVDSLPMRLVEQGAHAAPSEEDTFNLAAAERRLIRGAVAAAPTISAAALRLGISRATLYRKLKEMEA